MVAPQPELNALLRVIYIATIEARATAWLSESEKSIDEQRQALSKVASLTDAIHNIPLYLDNWENWDEKAFLNVLRCHDEKWKGEDVVNLESVYRNQLENYLE